MDNRVGKALFPAPSLSIMKHAQWNAYGKDFHETIKYVVEKCIKRK